MRIQFYSIDKRLQVNVGEVRQAIEHGGVSALMVVHYFGFPDPQLEALSTIAQQAGVLLIEDCAHALFSRDGDTLLGQRGDCSIFSLSKCIPVPQGGLLVCRKEGFPSDSEKLRRSCDVIQLLRQLYYAAEAFVGFSPRTVVLSSTVLRRYVILRNRACSVSGRRMGRISEAVLETINPDQVTAARRKNFEAWRRRVEEGPAIQPVYPRLPDGVSPLGFPVLVRERDRVRGLLGRRGISAPALWDLLPKQIDVDRFPESKTLSERILMLPAHQDLTEADIERVWRILTRALQTR